MDDIPILLTDCEADAFKALQTIDGAKLERIQNTLETDASMLVCGAVYYFTDGEPDRIEHNVRLSALEKKGE